MRKVIIGLALLTVVGSGAVAQLLQLPQQVSTRFGVLSVDKNRMLLFDGHPLDPPVQGNNSLDLGNPIRISATDVVLVRDNGGTACPFLYYFVTVSKAGVEVTPSFGTCGKLTNIKRIGKSISVTLRGYRGPFEPEAERRRAAKELHMFILREGVVTEKVKPVK